MSAFVIGDMVRWYRRLMDLFEVRANRQVVIDKLPALLMAAGLGPGSPPVRIEDSAVLVPLGLYELLLRLLDEHGLSDAVRRAVDADYERQEHELGAIVAELGLAPDALGDRGRSAA